MKRFLFLLLSFVSVFSFGQKQQQFETKIKYTPSKLNLYKNDTLGSPLRESSNKIDVIRKNYMFRNSQNDRLDSLFMKNSKELGNKKKYISKHIKPGIDNVVGKVIKNEEFTIYTKRGAGLRYYIVTGNDSLIGQGSVFLPCITKKFEIVRLFESENAFYVLSAKKKSKELNLYKFVDKGNYEHKRITVKSEVSNLLIENKLRRIITGEECSPEILNRTINNLYHASNMNICHTFCYNNNFFIVIDHFKKNTLLTIDLENVKSYEKTFEYGKNKNTTISIFEDKIFQLVISRDSLCLYISGLDGSIIKKHAVSSNDSLYFSNGSLYKNFQGYSKEVDYYNSFKKLLHNLHGRISLLVIDKFNNSLKIGIGTEKCYNKPGAMISYLIDLKASEFTYNYPKIPKTYFVFGAYFECLFDAETFEHIEGTPPSWRETNDYLLKTI